MIGLGKSIAHTGASMGYGWDQEKKAEVVYRQHLSGDNPKEITKEFKVIQSENHKCKKNTLSFVLSPTIKDGRELKEKQLREITERFVKKMKLQEHQAIAFVHRNKEHVHIHLYANRISFEGQAYRDSFIGKRSQQAAESVAKEMGLSTVRETQQQKLDKMKAIRTEIKRIHERVISERRPKDFDRYIKCMKQHNVQVVPSINRQNRLQGFRFEFKGHNLKGSEVHRSMSMGRIANRMRFDKQVSRKVTKNQAMKLMGNTVKVSPNLATKIAAKMVKQVIKSTINKGTGIGIEI